MMFVVGRDEESGPPPPPPSQPPPRRFIELKLLWMKWFGVAVDHSDNDRRLARDHVVTELVIVEPGPTMV